MRAHDELRAGVLDILAKRKQIGYGALVAQLQRRGHRHLSTLWKLLDELVDDGVIARVGARERPELVIVEPAMPPPAQQPLAVAYPPIPKFLESAEAPCPAPPAVPEPPPAPPQRRQSRRRPRRSAADPLVASPAA